MSAADPCRRKTLGHEYYTIIEPYGREKVVPDILNLQPVSEPLTFPYYSQTLFSTKIVFVP